MDDKQQLQAPNQALDGYPSFFEEIKKKIVAHQLNAASAVSQELNRLYWEVGRSVLEKQVKEGWGSKTIDRLASDLRRCFPSTKGFSFRNLRYMVRFAKCYTDLGAIQIVVRIPWGHNMILMDKVENQKDRIWYARKTIENGWSRSVLEMWLENGLHLREGKAVTNFHNTLPKPQSDLANQILKDPYCFDFLDLTEKHHEKDVEQGLLEDIQKFLIELGSGFAFVGRQYPITVDNTDYFLDLLFYHLKLRCFCVIDLKADKFMPEHVGKMNFYLSAVDDTLKHPNDNPSIGLILCKNKKGLTAEYALRGINNPIGVSGYRVELFDALPDKLKGTLPSIEQIQNELER